MNQIYRHIWSQVTQAWVVVAENAKGGGKSSRTRKRALAATALMGASFLVSPAYAADAANSTVVGGAGSVSQSGNTTTVNQQSQNLAIDWSSLSTAAHEALVFQQPNASAIALNRITGSSPSTLLGSLTANGQVYILNPNGVLFGAGAQVNVGGLVASTLTINPADFMAGSSTFTKDPSASGQVINQGTLTAANGGHIVLIGSTVRNQGSIHTPLGSTVLAAGDKVTLKLNNGSLIGYSIDEGALHALVENQHLIQANGGQVLLSAKALDSLTTATVNNTGIIEARTVQNKNGRIMLMGDMESGTVSVGGTLDASAPDGGDGGFIETSAAHVKVADDARITTLASTGQTGTWLIDPTDFNIVAGSAANNGSSIGATALGASLNSTNVTIATNNAAGSDAGDVNVNAAVTWNAGTTLTLSAFRNVNINASLTSQHASGKLALEVNQGNAGGDYRVRAPVNLRAGDNFSTKNGSGGATDVWKVITDLGAAGSTTGTDLQGMHGNLGGRYVLGADIDASATSGWSGGFRPIGQSSGNFTGTLDGLGHVISNLTINRPGTSSVGLISVIANGGLRNIGIVGGNITGGRDTGSLAGIVRNSGRIDNSYSTATVRSDVSSGVAQVGGLVGDLEGVLSTSYFAGDVYGNQPSVGGLAGNMNGFFARIFDSYSTGRVTSNASQIGGLVGNMGQNNPLIERSYSSGFVQSTGCTQCSSQGGLVGGFTSGIANNSFWDSSTTPLTSSPLGTGKTTAELMAQATYTGWDFDNTWFMVEGMTRPMLRMEYSTTINTAQQLQLMAMAPTATYTLARDINAAATSTAGSVWGTAGFAPVGTAGTAFTGAFNGASHVISNLTINRPGLNNVGLFGVTGAGATIRDLGLAGGTISGNNNVGAIAGANGGSISNSWSAATVTAGGGVVGGLVGDNTGGSISNSYAAGNVAGNSGSAIGGLVGENTSGTINSSYSTSAVSAGGGGLVGSGNGTVSNSYWDTGTSTQSTSAGGTGKTTAQMKQAGTFAGWSLANTGGSSDVWRIYEGQTGPLLRSFLTTLTVADAAPVTYNANVRNGTAITTSGGKTATAASGTNVGTYTAWSNQLGYDIIGGLLVINPFAVNLSGSRSYDGSTNVAAGAMAIGALVGGQTLTLSGTGAIADKNVGSGKAVSGFTLGNGTGLASNYTFTGGTQQVNVTTKVLSYTTAASNKVYDGSTAAAATLTLSGLVGSETLGSSASATFNSKNVASANLVTVNSATLSDGSNGGIASNYSIASGGTAAASISRANLAVTGISALNKVYDATTSAALSGTAIVTALGSDMVNVVGSGTGGFVDKNVGSGKAVTVTGYALSGTDAGNYTIIQPASLTANITQANLAVTGITAQNKVYDANAAATLGGTASVTAFGSDMVNLTGSGTGLFVNKNAGNNKGVSVTGFILSGTDALNYNLIQPQGLSANISQAQLAVTGISAQNKVYDATTSATLGGTATISALGSDMVNLSGSGTGVFGDKNVGSGKVVTVTGYTLSGTDAGNYTIVQPASVAANITQANLAVTGITAQNKVYDTTTAATLSGTASVTAFGSDMVNLTGSGTGVFGNKNAGNNKGVTVTGFILSGTDALNYNLIQPQGLSANISQAELAVTGISAQNKVYDATTSATLGGTATVTALGMDMVNVAGSGTGVFGDKNAGTGKSVTVSGYTLSGTDAANYAIVQPTSVTADITQASLAVTGLMAENKVYDATTSATLRGTATISALGSDMVNLSGSGTGVFGDKNAGTGKAVTITGYTLSGNDALNYRLTQPTGLTATINKADLTVTASTLNKVYDGSTVATVSYGDNRVTGDVLDITGSASFVDGNAGIGKIVNISGISTAGSDASNYNLVSTTTTSAADIARANLSVTASNDSRTAGGAPYAGGNGVNYNGFVAGETAAVLGGTLVYGGSAQGASTAGSYDIAPGGYSSGNYAISYVNGVLNIKPASAAANALGSPLLESSYVGALQAVGSLGNSPSESRLLTSLAGSSLAPAINANTDSKDITPRLQLAACGLSMADQIDCR